jgi:O-glycosyl hydrolase
LWALGQYSRFLRPGFTRVGAEPTDETVKTAAFVSPDGSRLSCVFINPTGEPIHAMVETPGYQARESLFYVTDETRDLAKVDLLPGEVVLPARSVSTLVCNR